VKNILDFDKSALADYFQDIGEKPYRAVQIIKWIHQRAVDDFVQMTDISKVLRNKLGEDMVIRAPEIISDQQASDGTRKWLLGLHDGNGIEMVYIPETHRNTLCISSQAGCALKCSFCHTAQQGFNRDLRIGEIIGQLWLANRLLGQRITNVVFMGMGEPLLNFANVVSAVSLMLEDNAYGLSKRRVTISTSGVVPAIDALHERAGVSLAVSLHAANNPLRDLLVPINKKYPIEGLLQACHRYAVAGGARRHVTFEYVMLADVNDRDTDARQLARLMAPLPAKINLIPFNAFAGTAYRCSSAERIERFKTILQTKGLVTTVRKTRGDDIVAACGQLAGTVKQRQKRWLRVKPPNKEGAV